MIGTVVFDMDGVIIDSEPIHYSIQNQMYKELGIDVSHEEYMSFVGKSVKNMWQQLNRKHSLVLDIDYLIKTEMEKYTAYLREIPNLEPIAGVTDLIEDLYHNKFRLVLASSATFASINTVLEIFKIQNYFSHKVSGAELEYSKPHPEIFQVAARLSQSAANQCIVIEDTMNGVLAAKAAKMKCIGFKNPNSGNQDLSKADKIIANMHELNSQVLAKF